MIRLMFILLLAVIVLIVGFIFRTYLRFGKFKTIVSRCKGECEAVPCALGCEDLTIDPTTGTALIACADRRAALQGKESKHDGIYAYALKENGSRPVNLTQGLNGVFRPLTLSPLYTTPEGKKLLFVNNCLLYTAVEGKPRKGAVEVFEYADGRLIHQESLTEYVGNLNDLVGVGPRQFYATVTNSAGSSLKKMAENFLPLGGGYVLYYDGKAFKKAATGIPFANGIGISDDGKTVYVASTTGKLMRLFDRDPKTAMLTKREDIKFGTAPDNLDLDAQGNIYLGCHPKLLTYAKHSKNPSLYAPSQVVKVSRGENGKWKVEEVYMNDGRQISAASIAAVYENKMIIGAVFDDHFILCTFPK